MVDGLSKEDALAVLYRVKAKMIKMHNEKSATLGREEFKSLFEGTIKPKIGRLMVEIGKARDAIGKDTKYDSRIDLEGV